MEIKIDESAVQEVVKQAIFDQLGAEGRERLVSAAIEHLLTEPPKSNYGIPQPSPLQQAFNSAAAAAAREIVMAEVATDERFQKRVREVVGEAMLKIDEMEFSDYVGTALAEALKRSRS